jgi:hypothetical protein
MKRQDSIMTPQILSVINDTVLSGYNKPNLGS